MLKIKDSVDLEKISLSEILDKINKVDTLEKEISELKQDFWCKDIWCEARFMIIQKIIQAKDMTADEKLKEISDCLKLIENQRDQYLERKGVSD